MNNKPSATLDSPVANWAKHLRFSRLVAVLLGISVVGSAIFTYYVMEESSGPLGPDPSAMFTIILGNLVLLTILIGLIAWRGYSLWQTLKRNRTGTRLQKRIIGMFCLVTIVPTLIVASFAAVFFNYGIKSWFDERVDTALTESVTVAEAYFQEHKETIRADAIAMAGDLRRDLHIALTSPLSFTQILNGQAALRNLTDAVVIRGGRVIARNELSFSLAFERLPPQLIEQASMGNVVIFTDDEEKIQALIQLDPVTDMYLLIGRLIDGRVIHHTVLAQGAVNQYRALQKNIGKVQLQFSAIFIIVSVMLLLASIWYGMYVAIRLLIPITELINASERVRGGDYTARVPDAGPENDEITILARTFNRMTSQINRQRGELIEANQALNERRRFVEAVFEGVSAGVIALDSNRHITLFNGSAVQMLFIEREEDLIFKPISELFDGIDTLLNKAEKNPKKLAQKDIHFTLAERMLTLHVRIAVELHEDTIEGFIVTFDDITELVSAQRSAAWADVARRIAHEIKNPLTPITLSTERLKRKFSKQISEDKEGYERYVDTIQRHVGDIAQMVEEFVSFARMPKPEFAEEKLDRLVREIMFSEKTVNSDISYQFDAPEHAVSITADARMIGQMLTNLLKNAAEWIRHKQESDSDHKGKIHIILTQDKHEAKLVIEDNGLGFPADKINTLTEPYVTHRAKGTGLGLAIVKKCMEEHGGSLTLENKEDFGARVILSFTK